jgi:predicted cupin superfamily sugar epimerase
MMEYEDMRAAMLDALSEHARQQEERAPTVAAGMLPVAPFQAETEDSERVTVIGVATNPAHDYLEFVVIKEDEDGEIYPTTAGTLWRRHASGNTD